MTNLPNCFGEWLKDPGAKTIGGTGKNKHRHGFLRRLFPPRTLREHFWNDENYFVKPAQWKNVNPKGSPDLRNIAAAYVHAYARAWKGGGGRLFLVRRQPCENYSGKPAI